VSYLAVFFPGPYVQGITHYYLNKIKVRFNRKSRIFSLLRVAEMKKILAPAGELVIHIPQLGGYEY